MEAQRIGLVPAEMPEWDAEDAVAGVLAEEAPEVPGNAAELLDKLDLRLPQKPDWSKIDVSRVAHKISGVAIPPDLDHYDFYVAGVPLTVIVPDD